MKKKEKKGKNNKKTEIELKKGEIRKKREKKRVFILRKQKKNEKTGISRFFPFFRKFENTNNERFFNIAHQDI